MTLIDLLASAGKGPLYAVEFLLGIGFGFVLERAGFGNSMKLAGQFYFRELTVLKVMFGAIITAMLLIFLGAGLGLLDYTQLWVNPTYLWPGIVGGLIMGVGFIVGGFCPGTSMVSAVTGKIDGMFFIAGTLFGIFAFGESVDQFAGFWNSSAYGRLTLFGLFGVPAGVAVLAAVLMALGMFKGGELLEARFGDKPQPKLPLWGVAGYAAMALVVLALGYPAPDARYELFGQKHAALLESRAAFVSPAEAATLWHDDNVRLRLWDLRSESDFNHFHLKEAVRIDPAALSEDTLLALRKLAQPNAILLIGWDEKQALPAWKLLQGYSIPNAYILEGGLDNWLTTFREHHGFQRIGDGPAWQVPSALGDRQPAAEISEEELAKLPPFEKRVRLQGGAKAKGGGCG